MSKIFCLFALMNHGRIIADSGGTKTDWCVIDAFGNKNFFTTCSYHSRNFDEMFISTAKQFWKEKNVFDYTLSFFGAGCLLPEKQLLVQQFFNSIGFSSVEVQSDLVGAGLTLNGGNGWGAICGTGSVVFQLENGNVSEIRGGLGQELGDEGSGYYFGKLVFEAFGNKLLSKEVKGYLIEHKIEKIHFSELPFLLQDFKNEAQIQEIHQKNIRNFRDLYLKNISTIGFVGSYAFHHQDLFRSVLSEKGIQVQSFIERPILHLIDLPNFSR